MQLMHHYSRLHIFTPHPQSRAFSFPVLLFSILHHDCHHHPDMSSHPYIDEFLFDRHVLTPSLHTPGQLEIEHPSDMPPQQFDDDWLTAYSGLCDQTVGREAMSGHIAATTSSLNNYLVNLETDQIATSYVVLRHTSHVIQTDKFGWGHVSLTLPGFNPIK